MSTSTHDNQEQEKSVMYFCPGCHRECDVELIVKGDEILSVSGNICTIGGNYARSQYEQDRQARR